MNFMLRPNSVLWQRLSTRTFVGTNQPVEAESSYAVDETSEDDISAHVPHLNVDSQFFRQSQEDNFGLNTNWKKWWKGSFGAHPGKCRLGPVRMPENFVNSGAAYLQEFYNYHPRSKVMEVSKKLCNVLYYRPVPKQYNTSENKQRDKSSLERYASQLEAGNNDNKNEQARHWRQIVYDRLASAAYLVGRTPAVYATTLRVLKEIRKRDPDFHPKAMLDYGSGTGTAVWAANETWGKGIEDFFCVDWSNVMNEMAQFIFTAGQENTEITGIYLRTMLPISFKHEYDLVIAAYTLSELPSAKERLTTLKLLWQRTKKYLVIIERGKYDGYHMIMEARNLIAKGIEGAGPAEDRRNNTTDKGRIFAPCPHSKPCPKWGSSPCSFSQSYIPPIYSKKFLGSEVKNEEFSYIVLMKQEFGDEEQSWPRVIEEPHMNKNQVICHLCANDGNIHHITLNRKTQSSDIRQVAKKSRAGDCLPYTSINGEEL